MAWSDDRTPGHDGLVLGLLPCTDARRRADGYRELSPADDALAVNGIYLRWVQVGCTCGWRSPRLDAPIGACWWPAAITVPAWFEQQCRQIWRAHAIATVFALEHGRTEGAR